jgi:hypothetical protein
MTDTTPPATEMGIEPLVERDRNPRPRGPRQSTGRAIVNDELLRLAEGMERELLPQYRLEERSLYGTNASNNAWHYTNRDETARTVIRRCADWLRSRAHPLEGK